MGNCTGTAGYLPDIIVQAMLRNGCQHGFDLFNSGNFFAAHEALEDIWREAPRDGSLRRRLQGLVQLAVAFHHQSTGNFIGARSVLERGRRNLSGIEESFPELDWENLRASLNSWREYLAEDRHRAPEPPALPRLMLRVQEPDQKP